MLDYVKTQCPICSREFKGMNGLTAHALVHGFKGKEGAAKMLGITVDEWHARRKQENIILAMNKPVNQVNDKPTDFSARPRKKSKTKKPFNDFFASRAWRELRYSTLKRYGAKCMLCGATPSHGAIIQVDHVKPRVKYPELELDENNLQVLCMDCNLGKSYTDETDWRPNIVS